MPAKRIKDLAVKTGSYTNNAGETKNRYENVGALMKSDDGSVYVLLKRTFNPAGVPVEDGRDQILISAFDLRDESSSQRPPAPSQPSSFPDDSVPF